MLPSSLSKTSTICGIASHLAPEMIFGEGYNKMADWWMLGVTLYELSTGQVKFRIFKAEIKKKPYFKKPYGQKSVEGLGTIYCFAPQLVKHLEDIRLIFFSYRFLDPMKKQFSKLYLQKFLFLFIV